MNTYNYLNNSLCGKALKWEVSSNLLNRSKIEEIKINDLGNLKDSLNEYFLNNQNLNIITHERTDLWTRKGEPIRFIARTVYTVAVGLILAPLDCIHHLTAAIALTGRVTFWDIPKYLLANNTSELPNNLDEIGKHAEIVSITATHFIISSITILSIANALIFGTILSPVALTCATAYYLFFYNFGYKALNISSTPLSYANLLRQELGLVGQNGKLLSTNEREDFSNILYSIGEEMEGSYIRKIEEISVWQKKYLHLKETQFVNNQASSIPQTSKNLSDFSVEHLAFNTDTHHNEVIDILIKNKEALKNDLFISNSGGNYTTRRLIPSEKNIQDCLNQIDIFINDVNRMGENNRKIKRVYVKCFKFNILSFCFQNLNVKLSFPDPEFNEPSSNNSIPTSFHLNKFQRLMISIRLNDEESFSVEDQNDLYLQFKMRFIRYKIDLISRKNPSPYKILEFEYEPDTKHLRKSFKKYSAIIHPDKVSEERRSEANELFKVLNAIYNYRKLLSHTYE